MNKIIHLKKNDAEELLNLVFQIDQESPNSIRQEGEVMGPVHIIEQWLDALEKEPRKAVFAIKKDHMLVAYLILNNNDYKRVQHVGSMMLGVLEAYQRQGLASALLTHAESWAKQQGVTRLELSAIAENTAALTLYKKHGFTQEGRKQKAFKRNGKYKDEILLAKLLE